MKINEIYNGDCLELMKDIKDESIDMILCDLPYGTTACKWDTIIPFEPLWECYKRIIKPRGAIVLFADEPFTSELICSNKAMFKLRITWDKGCAGGFLNSKKYPLKQTEDIALFCKGLPIYTPQMTAAHKDNVRAERGPQNAKKLKTYGNIAEFKHSNDYNPVLRYPTNLIRIGARNGECNHVNRIHPTQKPVALFEYLIKTYTNEGDLVLDNCSGSGTTAIACLNTNRKFICMEKDEEYFNVSQKRIFLHKESLKSRLF